MLPTNKNSGVATSPPESNYTLRFKTNNEKSVLNSYVAGISTRTRVPRPVAL